MDAIHTVLLLQCRGPDQWPIAILMTIFAIIGCDAPVM